MLLVRCSRGSRAPVRSGWSCVTSSWLRWPYFRAWLSQGGGASEKVCFRKGQATWESEGERVGATILQAPGAEKEEVLQAQSKGLLCILSRAKWKLQLRFIGETLLLNHKVQTGPTCFLNSSEGCLDTVGSNPTPRLGEWFMFKG